MQAKAMRRNICTPGGHMIHLTPFIWHTTEGHRDQIQIVIKNHDMVL